MATFKMYSAFVIIFMSTPTFVYSNLTATVNPETDITLEIPEHLEYCLQISSLIERNSTLTPQEQLQINTVMTSSDACFVTFLCDLYVHNETFCPLIRDPLGTCFPQTQPGVMAFSSCPKSLEGIPYDTNDNVTRKCLSNGTWAPKSDYNACKPILDQDLACDEVVQYFRYNKHGTHLEDDTCSMNQLLILYYVGTGLSLVTLVATFFFFWTLRSVRCWRNIIHWNFTGSLILKHIMWIILHLTTNFQARNANTVFCRIATTLFNYAHTTNYFWMFAEGLYLHVMVALAYVSDRIKLHSYLTIGWGLPVIIVGFWAIMKSQFEDRKCWIEVTSTKMVDYYYQIPIIITLVINAMILINIVRIIVTKLRSRTETVEEEVKHYVKAVKAALFLFPLLGITYLVYFVGPAAGSVGEIAFFYVNAILGSFQGFFVSVIYCFANAEIQNALMKKINAWKSQHDCFDKKDSSKRNYFSMNSMSRGSKSTIMFQATTNNQQTVPTSPITEEHAVILPPNENLEEV